ncbi:MAG: hypothetical protein ACO30L_04500, partial [Ilumatobacteraceae bacterium]
MALFLKQAKLRFVTIKVMFCHRLLVRTVTSSLLGCLLVIATPDLSGEFSSQRAEALGSYIYTACRQSGIYRSGISGGSTELLTEPGTPIQIHATDNYLYFSGDGKVQRTALDGSGVVTLVTGSGSYPSYLYGVDTDATYLYYGNEYSQTIGRVNLDGSSNNASFVDTSAISGLYALDVAINSTHIYFGGGQNVMSRK